MELQTHYNMNPEGQDFDMETAIFILLVLALSAMMVLQYMGIGNLNHAGVVRI